MKKLVSLLLVLVLCAAAFVGCAKTEAPKTEEPAATEQKTEEKGEEATEAPAEESKVYKIALSNYFIGNDWRQNMEAIAELVAADPYYADRVQLDIIDCDNSPEAQTASIDAISEMGYDAIIVDAASPTGITNALKRARDKGITIVVFDQVIEDDSFVCIECDWKYVAETSAKFIAAACGGEGNYVMDRGLVGSVVSSTLYDNAVAWLDANTNMKLVAEFESEYAEGPAEQGATAAMTANPQIDAVFSQGYINSIARAFRNAGREIPVITGGGSNGTGLDVVEYGDYVCFQWECNLAGLGAMAMEYAIQIMEGNPPAENHIYQQDARYSSTNPEYGKEIGVDIAAYEVGVNVFKEYPAGFSWPVLPSDFPVQIKPEDLIDKRAAKEG